MQLTRFDLRRGRTARSVAAGERPGRPPLHSGCCRVSRICCGVRGIEAEGVGWVGPGSKSVIGPPDSAIPCRGGLWVKSGHFGGSHRRSGRGAKPNGRGHGRSHSPSSLITGWTKITRHSRAIAPWDEGGTRSGAARPTAAGKTQRLSSPPDRHDLGPGQGDERRRARSHRATVEPPGKTTQTREP